MIDPLLSPSSLSPCLDPIRPILPSAPMCFPATIGIWVGNRIAAARQIADAFKQTYESNQPIEEITTLMDKLVNDEEQSVRMVVMEQIPEIAVYCYQVGEPLKRVIEDEILPHVITLLGDSFTQVRKVAQTGIVTLVERGIMSSALVEERVFPVILKLSELQTVEDHRPEIEVITFMCKMAPLVGKTAIVNSYLSSFCFSCEDTGFQVRRVCAMGMAEIAPVVGTFLTEKALLPRFLTLCEDEIWGVRKSCAEVFTSVARVCSYNVRRKCMAQAFINLLEDQSRWVRLTAFQTLGQLIATFFNEEGEDVLAGPDALEEKFLTEMKKCTKIVMEKRNQELVESNTRKGLLQSAATAIGLQTPNQGKTLNGKEETEFFGSGDRPSKEVPSPERAPDPFDDDIDDDEDGHYDWQSTRPNGEKQYSWLLDRSFGPGPDRDWGDEDEWGDVPMDCTDESDPINQTPSKDQNPEEEDDGFGEWSDGVTSIPQELENGTDSRKKEEDEEGVVTRDREKEVVKWDEEDKTTDADDRSEMSSSSVACPVSPFVVTSSKEVVEAERHKSEESELDILLKKKISVLRNEKKDRFQIHVETVSARSPVSSSPSTTSSGISSILAGTETSSYNTFQYWRVPIPDIELDIDMTNGKPTNVHVRAKVKGLSSRLAYSSELNVSIRMDTEEHETIENEQVSSVENGWGCSKNVENQDSSKSLPNNGDYTFTVNDTEGTTDKAKDQLTSNGIRPNDEQESAVTILLESNDTDTEEPAAVNTVGISQDVHRSYYNLYSVSNPPNNNEGSSVIEVKYQKKIEPTNDMDETCDDYYNDRFCSELNRTENLPYIVKAHGPSGDQGRLLPTLLNVSTVQDQDVVPPTLLKHYLSMADVRSDNSPVENEMPVYCAYTFPAVVITLGGEHWPILRECFEKLATMFQWKIRYTLGSCLHEIARVIGPELTERDLLPFYDAITKDIDEVRSGMLTHIAKFTRILRGEARFCVLDTLNSFLRTDNKNNWRFRYELSVQIEELTGMYDAEDIHRHLCPMALELAKDPIADVRKAALRAITEQVKKLNEVKDWEERPGGNLLREFILKLVEQFGHSEKWVQRQSFATLSGQLIVFTALDPIQFAQDILPHLISLSMDKVPNIRLTVAQTLSSHIMKMAYFADPSNPHNSILVDTIEKLQKDVDWDVRFYSGGIRCNPKTLKETAAATLNANRENASAQPSSAT